ncbi:MAG: DUF4129 domain-containing protein [Candidatus Limnocylindrales bacterium]
MAVATQVAPLALVIVAEAAWISVVAGLLQEFALREPVLGLPGLAAFVVAGVGLARILGPRLGDRWLPVGFTLVLAAGAIGWLLSGATRAALGAGLGPALAAHPGGWLAGLALLRGYAHARLPLAEDTVANLLAIGIPGLAVAATLGGVIGEPHRTRFLEDSLGASVVYIGATVLALAFARLDAIGLDAGFDWRRNPPWLLLTLAVVALAILLAIPLASIAGTLISVLLSVALGPLLVVGLISGFDRTARRILGFFIAIVIALVVLSRGLGVTFDLPQTAAPSAAKPTSPTTEQLMTIGIGGLLLVGLIVAIIVAIALWMRRTPPPDGSLGETRTIDPSSAGLAPRRRRRRFGRRPVPTTAVEAYVDLVDDLDKHAGARRDPAETPAAHAARIRSLGQEALGLDLLAADYALARYGGVALSPREDRRAVGRWRLLRKRLATWADQPGRKAGSATAADADRPVDLESRRTF